MSLGSIIPAMLMPGIIGTSTDSAITAEPNSKLLLYCAPLGPQKISAPKNSQMPTNATAHCAHVLVRGTRERAPTSATARTRAAKMLERAHDRHSPETRPPHTDTRPAPQQP